MAIDVTNNALRSVRNLETNKVKPDGNQNRSEKSDANVTAENSVNLTGQAQKLKALETSILEMPEVDMDRVASIKESIQNGSYNLNPERVAGKMLDFESLF